ncbi:MAG: CvpA family protein [Gammaproteobacteria bacterium]|nr:CvpA family protein [Gammaproteobacteria bacterium]
MPQSLSSLDFLIAGVVLLSIAVGIWRGFVKEFLSLLTWVISSFLAWVFAEDVAVVFDKDIAQPGMRLVVAFVVVFVIVFVLGSVATHYFNKLLTQKPLLKLSNYILGAAIGAARGGVIVVIGFLAASLLPAIPKSDWWKKSEFAPYFEIAALSSSQFLPSDIARHISYD